MGAGPGSAHRLVGEPLRGGLSVPGGASILLDPTRLAIVLAAGWLVARYVDHRPFAHYGFHFSARWWQDLGFGMLLGTLLMTTIFLALWLLGWVTVKRVAHWGDVSLWQALAAPLILSIVVAVAEELLVPW